jgi:hypothetical protein
LPIWFVIRRMRKSSRYWTGSEPKALNACMCSNCTECLWQIRHKAQAKYYFSLLNLERLIASYPAFNHASSWHEIWKGCQEMPMDAMVQIAILFAKVEWKSVLILRR